MVRVSAIVITRNEEANIAPCLDGLTWADEIVVLDSFSGDATVEISRRYTDRVYQRVFTTFANQRNAALDMAQGQWVFFLDADERTTPALVEEIAAIVARDSWGLKGKGSAPAGYWVPRQNFILGQWVRHAGWWPDHQMRLFRKDSGRYDENRDPHEIVVLQGESGFLLEPLVHHNYLTITQLFSKQNAYAHREAASLHSHGVRLKPHWLLTQPAQEFYRRYFLWEGYKGGITGLFLSAFMAWYRFLVYALLAARGGL